MKSYRSKFVIFSFVHCALVLSLFSNASFTPAVKAVEKNILPVEQVLKPDGTLDLSAGYSGNLDFSNFAVSLDPVLGPTFKPLSAVNSWNALGATPLDSTVFTIVIDGSNVYAGGFFQNAGGVPEADFIARFSGGVWTALGATPLTGSVRAIAINGSDVYAGGTFINAGGVAEADYIAKFNGSNWSALGTTPLNGIVHAIAISGSDVYAGGEFINAGGVAEADNIAKFSGGIWSALGGTNLSNPVFAITISGSDVYAGGMFINAGGVAEADFIAKFSGGSWSALGAVPLNQFVYAIAISGSDVYAGGAFTNAGGVAEADYIARFSGGSWSALGASQLDDEVLAITISGSDVYAGGRFLNAGGVAEADKIARFSGGSWSALGPIPFNERVHSIAISGSDVYAGGTFTDAGGDPNADKIARFITALYATFRSVGTNDGFILESTETSSVGGAMNSTSTTINLGDDASDRQYRAILHFNTSTLPDTAIITSAILKLKKQGTSGTDPFTILGALRVDAHKPDFGAATLELADFSFSAARNNIASFNTTPVSNWYSGRFSGTGRNYINKIGTTQFRIYFTTDDNDDNGLDIIKFYSGNAETSSHPKLVIQFYVP